MGPGWRRRDRAREPRRRAVRYADGRRTKEGPPLRPFRPKTTRLALAAVALLALSARRAKADAIYTVTDLGTDTVVTSPGHLVTVPDTAIRLLPSDLQTPRTQAADG